MKNKLDIGDYKTIYFIGIGGVSMNCLAQMLHIRGYNVSGSDQKESAATNSLISMGIKVFIGHSRENITPDIDLVVYTAAVNQDNIELNAAVELGIKIVDRAELLGLIMKNYSHPVCVSGTHGKTTTTSMLASIALDAETDPTILIGGYLESIGGSLLDGGKDIFIAESCEYFDSFLKFFPYVGIILNIEADHLDYFKDVDAVRRSFTKFAELIPPEGSLVINSQIDNPEKITSGLKCRIITFGYDNADWIPHNIEFDENGHGIFDAYFRGKLECCIKLSVPGEHNILNALAAVAASRELGISPESISQGLKKFSGVRRRFQYKGEVNGVRIVDDYAHHPTEIQKTLSSAKYIRKNDLWCVFQPHTHSRTRSLLNEFSECFDLADKIVIMDIYSPAGREEPSTHIHSLDLVNLIKKRNILGNKEERNKNIFYFSSFSEANQFLSKNCMSGDMLITMGAGDIYQLGESMLKTAL